MSTFASKRKDTGTDEVLNCENYSDRARAEIIKHLLTDGSPVYKVRLVSDLGIEVNIEAESLRRAEEIFDAITLNALDLS